ncbi:MAG: hypothetical protein AB7J35_20520 [Dehalococcoidia bacterium]
MTTDSVFHWARIAAPGTNFAVLGRQIEEQTLPALEALGGKRWALANGLFGLWNHEVILVTVWPGGSDPAPHVARNLPPGASVGESYDFIPTVRPDSDALLSRPGIYVHRLFGVDAANVDQFVDLSDTAWKTFENADEYRSQPQGLFRQRRHPEFGGLMLLVTWYDRLESWERSRTPPPEAAANFRERSMITTRSVAFPTRLLGANPAARGMGAG